MSCFRRFFVVAGCAFVAATRAFAQSTPDEVAALRRELAELKALVQAQNARIAALESRPADAGKSPTPAVPLTAAAAVPARPLPKGATGVEAYWKNGVRLRTSDDAFEVHPGGLFVAHGRWFTDDSRNTSTFLNRIARIILDGRLYRDWEFKIEGDVVGGEPELADGFLAFTHWKEASLKAGQFKEPFSMEELTGDAFVKFTERSPLNRSVPGRDLGVQLYGKLLDGKLEYALAAFNGNGRQNAGGTDTNDDKDVALRVVLQPWAGSDDPWRKGLYVAGATTWGNEEGAFADLSMVDSATVWLDAHPSAGNAGTTRREGTRQRWGGELAWLVGPLGLRAEWVSDQSDLERTSGAGAAPGAPLESTIDVDGWYVQATYWLTGEDETYGKRPELRRTFAPWSDEGGWGGVEAALRYSTVTVDEDVFDAQLAQRTVSTDEVNQWAAGVNWWFHPHARLMVDFYHNHFEDGVRLDNREEKDESLIMTRFQVDF